MAPSSIQMTVYRTKDPEVLALPEQCKKEERAWRRKVDKLSVELLGTKRRPMVQGSGLTTPRVIGFEATDEEKRGQNIPVGWRFDKKLWCLVPFRSKRDGKPIAKQVDDCMLPKPIAARLPGNVPPWVMAGMTIAYPCFELGSDGYGYVVFHVDLEKSNAGPNRFDPKIWAPVKVSTYARMKEQEAA